MPEHTIDINCDLGEIPYTEAPHLIGLLDYISSCNIATGFHAGDPYTTLITIQEAHRRGVAIGVHPSYPDKANFGRTSMEMSEEELYACLAYQISAISGMCSTVGAQLHHIKLHGALYHDAHNKKDIAKLVIRIMQKWPESLILYGQPKSMLKELARSKGIKWVSEGFVDRHYQVDGQLVPRSHKIALIENPEEAISQAQDIILKQKVKTIDQQMIPMNAQTLCIHGDHSSSLHLARQLQKTLKKQNIAIAAPAL